MATKTAKLSDGREFIFDSAKIKIKDLRLSSGSTDDKLTVMCRLTGLTTDEIDDLSLDDFLAVAEAFNEVTTLPKAS